MRKNATNKKMFAFRLDKDLVSNWRKLYSHAILTIWIEDMLKAQIKEAEKVKKGY